ncbi:MAG: two-component system cell cycle sensor histidine kinase/response regulator CckA [Candidatus Azotimanducaceae bacterium]|jgi:two-component system cell cycle sensor histidine kinase/response regulator CckA
MIVDDEPAIAEVLKAFMLHFKANVVIFTHPKEALSHFKSESAKIDIVITDQTMPDLSGIALSKKLVEIRADIKIIICTGYSVELTQDKDSIQGISAFLQKPVELRALARVVESLR